MLFVKYTEPKPYIHTFRSESDTRVLWFISVEKIYRIPPCASRKTHKGSQDTEWDMKNLKTYCGVGLSKSRQMGGVPLNEMTKTQFNLVKTPRRILDKDRRKNHK